MKKIFLLILAVLLFTSCFTKVDLEKTGNISLSIKWPNSVAPNSNINKSIKAGTASIVIRIHPKGNPDGAQEKTITNTGASQYSVEFNDLIAGEWHIMITCKDSGGYPLSVYEEYMQVSDEADTVVKTDFTGLRNIYLAEGYCTPDGDTNVEYPCIAVTYQGFQDKAIYSEMATVTFYISSNSDMSGAKTYEVITSSPGMAVSKVFYIGSDIEPNTKYYWKASISSTYLGNTYTKESPVYSFTTGVSQYLPNRP